MYRNSTFIVKTIFIFLLLIFANCNLLAQVPNTISYQGVLKDANGIPLTGSYNLLFKIYQSETGGTEIWQENQTGVDVQNGIFNVILGNLSTITFDQQYWLGAAVDGGVELVPRTKLTSVPYSLITKSIDFPFSGTFSGNGGAFSIIHNGSDGPAAEFSNTNLSNGASTLYASNQGSNFGEAATFIITNSNNEGTVVRILNEGTGIGAYIVNGDTQNDQPVIQAVQTGLGYTAYFDVENLNNNKPAIYVKTNGSPGGAAKFDGNVQINGDLSVSGAKNFVIDNPLDPENKILRHSSVESPERVNIYKGRAMLVGGVAVVNLPNYFDALNSPEGREVNLTPVNGWSPLYLVNKIANNQFTVKTTNEGNQSQEFSWVIYGVRNDKYAQDHPLVVEEEKGVNNNFKKGELINPDDVHAKLISESKNKTHNTQEH